MSKPYFRYVPNFEYVSRTESSNSISDYTTVKNLFKRAILRTDIFENLTYFDKYTIIGDERPDNVANKVYGNSNLDWLVLLANNIIDINSEWPSPQSTFDEIMLEKYGSYENLYGGVHHYISREVKNSIGTVIFPAGIVIGSNYPSITYYDSGINYNLNIQSATYSNSDSDITIVTQVPHRFELRSGQITISGISSPNYNGIYSIKSITNTNTFKVSAKTPAPNVSNAALGPQAQIIIAGLEVTVPSIQFTSEVSNYDYEIQMENDKRNIYVLKQRYLNVVFNDLDKTMKYKKGSQQYVSETLKRGDNIRLY